MPRVVVLDNLAKEGLAMLTAAPGIEHEVRTGLKGTALHATLAEFDGAICRSGVKITADSLKGNQRLKGTALRATLAEFDGAICRSGVKITADSLEGNQRLKAIVRAGVGTDNIDKTAATRAGIVVMNTPAGNTISTAEHTFAMMLALSRNIAAACQSLFEGRWDRKRFMGSQLAGKTLGIVGMGRIGQAVAARAKAFEMKVLGFDPFFSSERMREIGIEPTATVNEMLPHIDYLSVHTPLTDETRGLIGAAELKELRPGARLINCARGGIYDEAALAEGLKSGTLAGVALDVYSTEPCTESPLFGLPGVVATPHLGASTEEAQTLVATEAVGLLIDFFKTGAIRHAVNMAPVDLETLEGIRPFMGVAYRLGLLLAGMDQAGATACRVLYRGEIADKETRILTAAFAAGLLQEALDADVNIVNSEVLLRERGIELVEESRRGIGAFRSAMTAEVVTSHGSHVATGTVFGQAMPRLVTLDTYRLEAYLDGCLMVFTHQDVPGLIGAVGTILGEHQVNIAQMAVGRRGDGPGGDAIGVLNLDARPPAAARAAVADHPAISSVTVIELPTTEQMPAWLQG